jgi:hypothetical protein
MKARPHPGRGSPRRPQAEQPLPAALHRLVALLAEAAVDRYLEEQQAPPPPPVPRARVKRRAAQ